MVQALPARAPRRELGQPCNALAAIAVAVLLLVANGPAAAHSLQVFAMAEGDRITGRAYFAGGHPARGARIRVLTADGERLTTLTPDSDGAFGYQAKAARDLRIVAESADGHRAEWRIAASELAGAFGASGSTGEAAPASASAPEREGSSAAPAGSESSGRGLAPGGGRPVEAQAEGQAGGSVGRADSAGRADAARAEEPAGERAGDQSGGGVGGRARDQAVDWAEDQPEGRAGGQIFKAGRPALDAGRCAKPEQLDPAVIVAIEKAVARQVRPLREALAQSQARAQLQDILGGIGYILGVAGLGIWWTARQKRRAQASGEQR